MPSTGVTIILSVELQSMVELWRQSFGLEIPVLLQATFFVSNGNNNVG